MCAIAVDSGTDVKITLASEQFAATQFAHHSGILPAGGHTTAQHHILHPPRQMPYQASIVRRLLLGNGHAMSGTIQHTRKDARAAYHKARVPAHVDICRQYSTQPRLTRLRLLGKPQQMYWRGEHEESTLIAWNMVDIHAATHLAHAIHQPMGIAVAARYVIGIASHTGIGCAVTMQMGGGIYGPVPVVGYRQSVHTDGLEPFLAGGLALVEHIAGCSELQLAGIQPGHPATIAGCIPREMHIIIVRLHAARIAREQVAAAR